ncbi:unnamed protein product [Blepharisma stoltei]|uniref:rRNA-processing protein FYV7 n=1 Tax=Blepharisma stoltei TaxID=1481888 RepID=A0AAU9J7W2_9CILI|nr:unnamed protein product [Blepharisma stoltei]
MVKRKKEKNDFVEAVHDIRKLATERMDSKFRKRFLDKEAQKLGAKQKKNPKIPYNIYKGILRKEKELKENARNDALLSKESNWFNPVEKKKKKKEKRNPMPTGPEIGKYKSGTLYIKKPNFLKKNNNFGHKKTKFRPKNKH